MQLPAAQGFKWVRAYCFEEWLLDFDLYQCFERNRAGGFIHKLTLHLYRLLVFVENRKKCSSLLHKVLNGCGLTALTNGYLIGTYINVLKEIAQAALSTNSPYTYIDC
ncbi:hypothetical protein, partial [Alteromonas stellipolaris]|uniref:hypothetical protein n=1 Tax=Alteromonas stellipolaris TaxID=233316 RepID=UPI001D297B9A